MHSLIVHISNEEPIVIDADSLPEPTDNCVIGMNPRTRTGKEIHYIASEVTTVIFPWHRISFIEVMPSGEEEEIVSFIRD